MTVMATCVSLALPMGVAHAQAPAAGAPPPAAANDEVVDADEAESAPTSEVAPTAAPVVEGPAPQAQAPAVESGGMFPTLVNEDLVMSMRDGSTFHGRLLAVQEPWLICARLEDGRVVAVLRTEVAQVHALPPAQAGPRVIKQDTGAGRIGAGIAMVTGGGVMVIGGIWGGIYYGTAGYGAGAYVWLPLILPAALMIGVGIPLIVRGGKIQREFRGKLPRAYQAKLTKRRKVAWDGGLRLRF